MDPRIPGALTYDNSGRQVGAYMPQGPMGPEAWNKFEQEDNVSIFSRLRRRKAWFIATTMLTASAVFGAYMIMPKTYRAEGTVLIQASNVDSVVDPQNAQAAMNQNVGDAADIESQLLLLDSPQLMHDILYSNPEIAKAVMKECLEKKTTPFALLKAKIHQGKSCDTMLATDDEKVQWMSSGYTVASAGRSRVISVTYTSPDPAISKLMVNTLINAYVAQGIQNKLAPRTQASAWLDSKLKELSAELATSEQEIVDYSQKHGLIRGSTGSIQSEDLSSLSQQLALAEATRAQSLSAWQQSKHGVSSMNETTSSNTISALRAQQAEAEAHVASLAATLGRRNPVMIAARENLNAINAQIGGEVGRVGSGFKQAFQAADAQVLDLERQIDALKGQASTASDAESKMQAMTRNVEVKRDIYANLQKQADQLETDRRLVAGDERVISQAYTPDSPWFPKTMPFATAGLIASLFLGFAVALGRDKADKTVRATTRLEHATGVAVLGHVPAVSHYKQKRLTRGRTTVTTHPQLDKPSALQESIRYLYGQCLLLQRGKNLKTVMVTSSNAGEGKTFLTLALAQFAAKAEKRVLVVEADMRKPTMAERLQVHSTIGLVDYLRGKAAIEATIQPTKIPGLDVITAGRSAIDSSELLSTEMFSKLLEEAKTTLEYDLIFIDSPPSQVLLDARWMAPQVDGILYSAKWGVTSNDSIAMGVKALEMAGGNVIGITLGQVRSGEYTMYETRPTRNFGPYLDNKG